MFELGVRVGSGMIFKTSGWSSWTSTYPDTEYCGRGANIMVHAEQNRHDLGVI